MISMRCHTNICRVISTCSLACTGLHALAQENLHMQLFAYKQYYKYICIQPNIILVKHCHLIATQLYIETLDIRWPPICLGHLLLVENAVKLSPFSTDYLKPMHYLEIVIQSPVLIMKYAVKMAKRAKFYNLIMCTINQRLFQLI